MARHLVTKYVKESQQELQKVIWPSSLDLRNHTILVVAVSLSVAIFMGSVDYLATLGLEQFLRLR